MLWEVRRARPRWESWHRWFAWKPVTIGDMRVWLEVVERRGEVHAAYDQSWIQWEYRWKGRKEPSYPEF